jgi:hypothetical protein
MAASRAGFRKKSTLWLVLVRIPPAKVVAVVIMKTTNETKIFFITFKLILPKTAAKVRKLHKMALKVHILLILIN